MEYTLTGFTYTQRFFFHELIKLHFITYKAYPLIKVSKYM
jgi:hypothetical protein